MKAPPSQLQQALARVAGELQAGHLDEAERLCQVILQSDPKQVDALNLLGVARLRRGQAEDALEYFTRAYGIDRRFTDVAYNLGVALGELERWEQALIVYDRVLRTDPSNARAWNNRGNVLQKLDRWKEALAAYDRTLSLQPNHPNAHHNRGLVLLTLGRPREALAAFERAVTLAPANAEAQWTKSLAHLLLGEYEAGWRLHEWRWKTAQMGRLGRGFHEPLWLGEAGIQGKTLLLHADQGLGDSLLMARYAPLVEAQGAKVVLEVQPPLVRLMESLSPTIEVVAREAPLPRFDAHSPLGSLPLAFRTTVDTIPSPGAYLRPTDADVQRWSERLGAKSRPRIGIAWSGNPRQKRDRYRSIPFALLAPCLDARFEWHALQVSFRDGEESAARDAGVRTWSEALTDFGETAALAANLDLVVTVDTSVVHLGGAIGKPTWVLVTWESDWRWGLEREDTPWYASVRVIRQAALGDWDSALARLRAALESVH